MIAIQAEGQEAYCPQSGRGFQFRGIIRSALPIQIKKAKFYKAETGHPPSFFGGKGTGTQGGATFGNLEIWSMSQGFGWSRCTKVCPKIPRMRVF